MNYKTENGDYTLNEEFPLKPEQNEIIDFIFTYFNVGISAQTGFGKTYISLTAAERIMAVNPRVVCFIICPLTANSAFKKELKYKIKKDYSIYTTNLIKTTKDARYLIFNYSRLEYVVNKITEYTEKGYQILGVFDEVHCLASATSKQSILLRKLRDNFTVVLGMTATPLTQNLVGTYWIADFIRPGCLGNEWQFKANYCIFKKRVQRIKGGRIRIVPELVGYKNLDHLSEILKTIFITKRNQYNLNFSYRKVKLTDEEYSTYLKAADGILGTIAEDTEEKTFSARLHDLQRVADGSHELIRNGEFYSKIKELLILVKEIIDRDEGCIIFTDYEDTYTVLHDALCKYKDIIKYKNIHFITGKTKAKDRQNCEDHHGRKDIIIMTKAGCQSLNLQKVNNVIFYDTPFAILQMIQAIGRVTRMDTTYETQNIYVLECEETIDTYKRMLVQEHTKTIAAVFGKETNLPDVESIDTQLINKYRAYFKNKFLWKRNEKRKL